MQINILNQIHRLKGLDTHTCSLSFSLSSWLCVYMYIYIYIFGQSLNVLKTKLQSYNSMIQNQYDLHTCTCIWKKIQHRILNIKYCISKDLPHAYPNNDFYKTEK